MYLPLTVNSGHLSFYLNTNAFLFQELETKQTKNRENNKIRIDFLSLNSDNVP